MSFLESFSLFVSRLDSAVLLFFAERISLPLLYFFTVVTFLGSFEMLLAVVLFSFWYLPAFASRRMKTGLLVSVGVAQALVYSVKYFINRPRPVEAIFNEATASFPSGHTATAVALYGFIAYALIMRAPHGAKRHAALAFGTLVPLFVAFSRLYLGVHYLSDVVVGAFIGLFGLVTAIFWCEKKIDGRRSKK